MHITPILPTEACYESKQRFFSKHHEFDLYRLYIDDHEMNAFVAWLAQNVKRHLIVYTPGADFKEMAISKINKVLFESHFRIA